MRVSGTSISIRPADITAQTNVVPVAATIDVDIDPMVYMIGVSLQALDLTERSLNVG